MAKSGEIGKRSPDQHGARLLDEERHRVPFDRPAKGRGHGAGRIEDRAQVHHHRGDDRDGLRQVAQIHAQRRQRPRQPQDEQDQRQQHDQDQRPGQRQPAQADEHDERQDREADDGVEQARAQHDPGHDLEREDDPLHEARVLQHQRRRAVEAFGKDAEHEQPGEQDDGKLENAGRFVRAPARLEHDAENERVDAEHQQRIEERPHQAEKRSAVAAEDVAPGEIDEERAMPPGAAEHRKRLLGQGQDGSPESRVHRARMGRRIGGRVGKGAAALTGRNACRQRAEHGRQ